MVNEDETPGVKLGGVGSPRAPKGATTNFESPDARGGGQYPDDLPTQDDSAGPDKTDAADGIVPNESKIHHVLDLPYGA